VASYELIDLVMNGWKWCQRWNISPLMKELWGIRCQSLLSHFNKQFLRVQK
jgi:hypothetical protein